MGVPLTAICSFLHVGPTLYALAMDRMKWTRFVKYVVDTNVPMEQERMREATIDEVR